MPRWRRIGLAMCSDNGRVVRVARMTVGKPDSSKVGRHVRKMVHTYWAAVHAPASSVHLRGERHGYHRSAGFVLATQLPVDLIEELGIVIGREGAGRTGR